MTILRRAILLAAMLLSGVVSVPAAPAPDAGPRPDDRQTGLLLGVSRARLAGWRAPVSVRRAPGLTAGLTRAVRGVAAEMGGRSRSGGRGTSPGGVSCGKRTLMGTIIGGLSGIVFGAVVVSRPGTLFYTSSGGAMLVFGGIGAAAGAGIGALTCL